MSNFAIKEILSLGRILKDDERVSRIVSFSLLLALITGFLIGILSPFYGIAVVVFFVFISLTLFNIRYGILFWILTGGLFVIPLYTVRNARIYPSIVILLILLLFWFFLSVEKGTFGIIKSRLFWPLVILMVITFLSSLKGGILYDPDVTGEHRFVSVQIIAFGLIMLSLIATFLIPRFFRAIEQIRMIYFAFIILGVELFIFKIANLSRFGFIPSWFPMMQAHVMSLSYASLLFMPELSIWKKMGFVIMIIFSFEFVFQQFFSPAETGQWISGWIAMSVPISYITFHKSKKWGIYFVIFFLILIFILANKQIVGMFTHAEKARDFDRLIMWNTSLDLWQRNPVLGIGPGNYIDYALVYAPKGFEYTSAHNQYFQILTDLGVVGFFCFFWIVVKIISLGRFFEKTIKDDFLKLFVIGSAGTIYGQLCASVFGDYILPSYHNGGLHNFPTTIYFWVLVGSLMAVEQINIISKENRRQ